MLIEPRRLGRPPPTMVDELAELWLRAAQTGGAVGFPPDAKLSGVRVSAERAVARHEAGEIILLTVRRGGRLLGVVWLEPGHGYIGHRAMLLALMVHPHVQRMGIGTRLLDACVELGRELGLEQLYLSTRDKTGLPEYYAARGWTEIGRFYDGIRLGPNDYRDEVWFQLRL